MLFGFYVHPIFARVRGPGHKQPTGARAWASHVSACAFYALQAWHHKKALAHKLNHLAVASTSVVLSPTLHVAFRETCLRSGLCESGRVTPRVGKRWGWGYHASHTQAHFSYTSAPLVCAHTSRSQAPLQYASSLQAYKQPSRVQAPFTHAIASLVYKRPPRMRAPFTFASFLLLRGRPSSIQAPWCARTLRVYG